MEGYLLLIIMLLYAELSLCARTRAIGRILFYTHTLGIITPLFAPTVETGIAMAIIIYSSGLLICAELSTTSIGRITFALVGINTFITLAFIYSREYMEILIFGWNLLDNSDVAFRWGILGALGMCSSLVGKDDELRYRDAEITIASAAILVLLG